MKNDTWAKGLRTTAVHAGEAPDPATGASAPNLVMSTTYVLDKPMTFSAQDLGEEAPYIYTRWGNPTVRQLEDKLAALEGAESCLCFASGMAASTALLLGLLGAGDHLVASDTAPPGWTSLAVTASLFGAVMFLMMSVLGEYLSRILRELSHGGETPVREVLD